MKTRAEYLLFVYLVIIIRNFDVDYLLSENNLVKLQQTISKLYEIKDTVTSKLIA